MIEKLLYIHGFNSSPQSEKAQLTQQYFAQHYADVALYMPQLKNTPNEAIEQLSFIVESLPQAKWGVMGSSLGGYFATYLAEHFNLKAVLINPAVKPFELLQNYFGEQKNPYTQETFIVHQGFIDDLKKLYQIQLKQPKNYFVLVQTGDEVLDYQQAVNQYQHSQLIVEQGGDHSFVNYEQRLPQIAEFFKLSSTTTEQ